jgi:carboxypeptidase T
VKLAFYFLVIISVFLPARSFGDEVITVRVYFDTPEIRQACYELNLKPLAENFGYYGDFIVSDDEIKLLQSTKARFEILSEKFLPVITEIAIDSIYHTYEETVSELFAYASYYPAIAYVESIGISQQEQKAIYAFKISDNVYIDEDEPVVYFDGTHHACEVMGLEICMALIDTLLENYGLDSNIIYIIDNTEIWLVPLVNPDGHSAVIDSISLFWRKNGRDLNGNDTLYEYECNDWWTCYTEGIDLNRNYDWYWEYGGSSEPWSYYYRGESPGSEAENQALTSLLERIKPLLSLSYHSYGEVIYFPWLWMGNYAPDHDAIYSIAQGLASSIMKENGQDTYGVSFADGRSGMASNWQYGHLGSFCYMPETVKYPDFIIPPERYRNVVSENLNGCFYFLQRAHGPQLTGIVSSPETSQPVRAEIRIVEIYSDILDPRFSDTAYGRYNWLLLPGIYTLQVLSEDFIDVTFSDITVRDSNTTVFDVYLYTYVVGDANGDGEVNGSDVTFLVMYFKGFGSPPEPLLAGDANGNCHLTGSDVTYLVAYFKGGPPPIYGDCW